MIEVHLSSGCYVDIQLLSPALAFLACVYPRSYLLTNKGALFLSPPYLV